jgi:hypothetical protein
VASGRDVPHDQCDQERALSRTRERHRERTRFGRESSRRLARSWGRPLARACPSVCFSSVTASNRGAGFRPPGPFAKARHTQPRRFPNEVFAALERGLRRCLDPGGSSPGVVRPIVAVLRYADALGRGRPLRSRPSFPQPLRRLTPDPRPLTPSRKDHVQARVVHPPTLSGTIVGARVGTVLAVILW